MISFKYLISRLKDVKIKDIVSVFPMIAAGAASVFFKRKYENTWLICEEPGEARDNGYNFFGYMRKRLVKIQLFFYYYFRYLYIPGDIIFLYLVC